MVWFKVDDNLAFHHKAMAAGNTAVGMWVRAGSFSASQLTDGFVPDHMVPSLGTKALAGRLVAAGLWHKVKGGFQFHEWDLYQPTKTEVEKKRDEARERMARNRTRTHRTSSDVRANTGRTSDSVTPTPSRPVPTSTAAAAPERAAGGGKIPVDDLPGPVLKLRDRFAALTVLNTVRFTDLTPEKLDLLLPLIDRHGVDTLTDFARRTQRPVGGVSTVQGFIPTWSDVAAPRAVVDEPMCPICSRSIRACEKTNLNLAPEDRCEGTAA